MTEERNRRTLAAMRRPAARNMDGLWFDRAGRPIGFDAPARPRGDAWRRYHPELVSPEQAAREARGRRIFWRAFLLLLLALVLAACC